MFLLMYIYIVECIILTNTILYNVLYGKPENKENDIQTSLGDIQNSPLRNGRGGEPWEFPIFNVCWFPNYILVLNHIQMLLIPGQMSQSSLQHILRTPRWDRKNWSVLLSPGDVYMYLTWENFLKNPNGAGSTPAQLNKNLWGVSWALAFKKISPHDSNLQLILITLE